MKFSLSGAKLANTQTCFEDVTADGTNTILLIPEVDIDTDNLPSAVSKKRSDLQTNSGADLSVVEPNPEDSSEGEETVHKRVARRDSRRVSTWTKISLNHLVWLYSGILCSAMQWEMDVELVYRMQITSIW